MKKSKTVAYMLAATLLVGGTFAGTKALFTDNIDNVGELKISTGDVDIKVLDSSKWTIDRNGVELKEGSNIEGDIGEEGFAPSHDTNKQDVAPETPFANNLKPGDILTKKVTIKNIGTLNAKLTLDDTGVEGKLGELKDFIKPGKTAIVDKNNNGILEPGEEAEFTLTLTAEQDSVHNTSSTGEVKDNNDTQEDAIVDLTNAWILNATQTIK